MRDLFDEIPAHITQTQRILSQFISQLYEFEREIVPKIEKIRTEPWEAGKPRYTFG